MFRYVPFFPTVPRRSVPTFPSGLFTSPVLKNNTGTILASETGVIINFYDPNSGALALQVSGKTSDGSGIISFSTGSLPRGATYAYEVVLASNGRRLPLATLT